MKTEPARLPTNAQLAALFQEIADYLALQGESSYRILAYEKAAGLFRDHPVSVAEVATRGELRAMPGVGAAIEAKVLEYIANGEVASLEDLRSRYPEGLLIVMRLPGMGPRKTRLVWENAGVGDIRDLERACREGRIRDLPGMGEKTEARILSAIETWLLRADANGEVRRLRSTVEPQAAGMVEALEVLAEVEQADYAGSLRRLRATVKDIDLVVASTSPGKVMDAFGALPEVERVAERGDTKLVARTHTGLSVDLRIVPPTSYGNLLQHLTGSAEHNVALRGHAQRNGFKISEYHAKNLKTGREIKCGTETEVYELVGLNYIPPELRENQGEIEAVQTGGLPELVRMEDIRGDLHVHSDWTDGRATLEEMAAAAKSIGLEYLCFCDHSQSLAMTGGLSPERLMEQIQAIQALDQRLEGIRLLTGIEVDILSDGRLDIPDDVLARLDFVTASIHSGFTQSQARIMERISSALHNPHVDSIGHPSGRLLGRRDPYELDIEALAQTAAETGTHLEINGCPDRLDLTAQAARKAAALGATLIIASDAHSPADFENLRFGIQEARRGWLRATDIANTLAWGSF